MFKINFHDCLRVNEIVPDLLLNAFTDRSKAVLLLWIMCVVSV